MAKKKSLPICSICYNTFKKAISPCECSTCEMCWTQLIVSKIEVCTFMPEKITCPTIRCQEEPLLNDLYNKLPRHLKLKIDQASLNIYLSKAPDIRRCPSSGCNYAGIIDLSLSCSENLACNACGTTWRDKVHYNKTEKLHDFICNVIHNKNEVFSAMWKRWKAKKCPHCEVLIEKDEGCEHMTCTQCQYEFCWICLEEDPQHNQSIHNNIKLRIFQLVLFLPLCFGILYLYYLLCVNFVAPATFILPARDDFGGILICIGRWIGAFILLPTTLYSAGTLHGKVVYHYYARAKRFYVSIILICLLGAYYSQLFNHIIVVGGIDLVVLSLIIIKLMLPCTKRQIY